jgi:PhnB protein
MAVKPIPAGYHSITPGMNLKDAAKAIEFFKKAFGAEETVRMPGPDGKIAHCEMRVGDSVIMLGDAVRDPVQTLHAMLYVPDCDAVYKRAIDAGATAKSPLVDHPWGDRGGRVIDPFGNHWFIATHKEDLSMEEIERRMKDYKPPQNP